MTNCCECRYGYNNGCKAINRACFECANFNDDTLECRCTEVEDTANCPHFEDWCGGDQDLYGGNE